MGATPPAPPTRQRFDVGLNWLIRAEGGFVNDPNDPGGATNMGVSLRAVQLRDVDRDGALDFDLDRDGDVDEWDIRLVTPAQAAEFYRADYWNAAGCTKVQAGLDVALFDSAVLQGPRTATALLQLALKVTPDGLMGPRTAAAARALPLAVALPRFQAERVVRMTAAPAWRHYSRGWVKRLFQLDAFVYGA